ncbi:ATP-grasp domain-containing protein [Psychromarinibacter sp. C21-152]|uniref:ATP-grasp domain-containing protein n=1 Tax=Psychromarinibacter sediminicola TaxID=3033385 RepID=A0AAE3NSD7_9RHOB|nr:ATP-grasp domain-containing protein [Psychromarinibacter sediminicola]MDF0601566.1 ATP-grasp domain-containing protein [Psychromarinibacter sediminicola]
MAKQHDPDPSGKKLVCVVGTDEFHQRMISRVPEAKDWQVEQVLHRTEVQPHRGTFTFDGLYDRAREIIDGFDRPPDAIVGHLDFPVTALVSLLCRDYGLPGASPEAVARCEHKFWMRKCQREVLPDDTPEVRAVNPFAPGTGDAPPLPYPFWLKPVKGHSSMLGFRVREPSEYGRALHACRQAIHRYGEPFNEFLNHLNDTAVPPEANGNHAVAEELIAADQMFTIEGFVKDGEVIAYGVIETRRTGRHMSSLSSYHYPAELPEEVVEAARAQTAKVLDKIGFDDGPFNVEFFRDPDSGALNLLEINARMSKSHSPLFQMVDGCTHHRQVIQLALGEEPKMPAREGKSRMAAKYMVRTHEANGIVRRVPQQDDIDKLRDLLPDMMAQVLVEEGQSLADLSDQDSYSFELMDIFLGGDDAEFIQDAHDRCRDSLIFLIQPMPRDRVR